MYNYCSNCGSQELEKTKSSIKCQSCGKTIYINSKPTASVIPVFQNKILVGVRKDEPEKGKLDILGGFLENGEDPEDGALRELEEESGLEIEKSDLHYLGVWIDDYQFEEEHYYTFNMLYYVLFNHEPNGKPADDISELKWVEINPNLDLAFKTQKESVKKLQEVLKS